jgi:hypothetical protein
MKIENTQTIIQGVVYQQEKVDNALPPDPSQHADPHLGK